MISQLYNNQDEYLEKASRPSDYPTPENENLLFFIQRNGSLNTVVYEINLTHEKKINAINPMKTYWIRYSSSGEIDELNYIQNKLAYGYDFKFINDEALEFNMVSYPSRKFYLAPKPDGKYGVSTKIDDELSFLHCMYVVVDELGVFPNVKYVELWGNEIVSGFETYEKVII
jgi:hypothetical protein